MPVRQPKFLEIETASMWKFRKANTGLVSSTEKLLWMEWQVVSLVLHCCSAFSTIAPALAQQLHEYHRESALLSMRNRPNAGMALTRMACELSRDILRLATDKEVESLWLRRESNDSRYRAKFRFDDSESAEVALYNIYKLSTRFGVHGHIAITEPTGAVIESGDSSYVKLELNKDFVRTSFLLNAAAVQMFLFAFLTLHGRRLEEFGDPLVKNDVNTLVKHLQSIDLPIRPTDLR